MISLLHTLLVITLSVVKFCDPSEMLFILSWSRSHTLQIHPPMLDFFLQSSFKKKKERERHGYAKRKEKNAHISMEHDGEKKEKKR
jgi:hypothetical protein